MGYRIVAFDGIDIPDTLNEGDEQNMGTGEALVSFQPLPNGFYDNYGTSRSPQGIRPIVKSGLLYATTAAALKTEIDDLRSKLGVRGKLTVEYDDGAMRWQWARLKTVDCARPDEAKGLWCPFHLEWVTASQIWYGVIVSDEEWTWGDLTWTFGDGTAEFGENGTLETLTATGATGTAPPAGGTTQSFTVNNGGNRAVTNMVITVTAVTNDITAIDIANATTGESMYHSAAVSAGNVLVIDCGGMDVTNNGANSYTNFVPDNKAVWMTLDPGDNTITIAVNGNAAQDGTIAFEYYDHYH